LKIIALRISLTGAILWPLLAGKEVEKIFVTFDIKSTMRHFRRAEHLYAQNWSWNSSFILERYLEKMEVS
jgi:hypothetical protein